MLKNTVFSVLLLLVFAASGMAGDFQVLHSFDGTNGAIPYGSVIYDNGKLYGTTVMTNTTSTLGTIFSLDIDGSGFTVLKSFTDSAEGEQVYNGLTYSGGDKNVGTMYEYSPSTGTSQTLYSFSSPGCKPFGSLTPVGEYLYGMTSDHRNTTAYGNIFRYKPSDGTYEVVHEFTGTTTGGYPYDSLTWDGGNWVYGTTLGYYPFTGETEPLADEGVVFRFNIATDEYQVIHDFSAQSGDGAKPNSSMLIGDDGWIYGIAHGSEIWGGEGYEYGTLYRMQPDGSEFEVLHTFNSMADGNVPMRSLIMVDGVIYGTTAYGGQGEDLGYGTVWSYDTTTVPEPTTIAMFSAGLLGLIRRHTDPGKK